MLKSPQLFGALALAKHRNGSPIKLPRAKDEVVMLAFDQQNHRLVELHIVAGKAVLVAEPSEPTQSSALKPVSGQSHRKLATVRADRRNTKPAGCRQVRNTGVRVRQPANFYQKKPNVAQSGSKPELVDAALQHTVCGLLREATGLRSHSFMTLLEVGMDDGLAYYVTTLNDGEFIEEYVRRRGAVPTVTALALLQQLLQDLDKAEKQTPLVTTMRLDRVLVASPEGEHLQLRVFDYGLSQPRSETRGENSSHLVGEACQLLFLLLTGQAHSGGNPDKFSVIAELPTSLRFVLKSVMTRPKDHALPLKKLRDEVREALCSLVTLVQARNPKMLLMAEPATLPMSHLQSLLLDDTPLEILFGANFRIENSGVAGGQTFAIAAVSVATDQPLTLHLLPPERIVNQSEFMALSPQAWRQDPAKQPNLLPMTSLWKGPDWSFVAEVREPGMPLSSLMAKRGALNPAEVILVLRQIHAGLEQALETGVERADLDPASMQLCVGYDGAVLARDLERLYQKRLDAWPKFMVKLRLYKTMRSLCKPRLVDLSPWECDPTAATVGGAARDERHRCFIGLAAYLLTGEGRIRKITEFPTGMPEVAAGYLLECLQWVLRGDAVPAPLDFTNRLHLLLTASNLGSANGEVPLTVNEIESAGLVSDFEEDWSVMDRAKEGRLSPVNDSLKTLDFNGPLPPKPAFQWLALAATLVLLAGTAWMILGDLPGVPAVKFATALSRQTVSLPDELSAPVPAPVVLPPPPLQHQPVIHKISAVTVALSASPPAPSPAPVADSSPPPLVVMASPTPVIPKSKPPAPSLEKVKHPENQQAEKVMPTSAVKPQLVATASTVSSVVAPDPEPVTIRRAIPAARTDAAPTQGALAPTALATNLPHPPTAPELPPAPARIVAIQEPIIAASPVPMTVESQPAVSEQAVAPDAVTIRHAISVSPEEIKQTARPRVKSRQGKSRRR